jgi:acetolactate synthase-1/2/3 large subunit
MGRDLADTIAASLAAAGVDRIFGLPGGGPNLDLVGAGAERGIGFVLTHTETASAVMAGTYGLLRGEVGAALCTRGPGLASAINGLAQATLDRYPLVLFADTVPAAQRDRIAHQRLDQTALSAAATKWSAVVGTGDAAATVDAALRLAGTAPKGAVHLDVDPSAPSAVPGAGPGLTRRARTRPQRLPGAGGDHRSPRRPPRG